MDAAPFRQFLSSKVYASKEDLSEAVGVDKGLGHANCPPPRHTFARFYTQKEQCKKLPFFERVFSRPMKLGVQNTLRTLLLHDD